jgi:hypothetical protein
MGQRGRDLLGWQVLLQMMHWNEAALLEHEVYVASNKFQVERKTQYAGSNPSSLLGTAAGPSFQIGGVMQLHVIC